MITPPQEIADTFFPRKIDSNKYTVGTVTVVGGSGHYIHAPVIAGLGARAAGAGLVQLVVPDASRISSGALLPEATFTKLTPTCVVPKADVTVVGMGLGAGMNAQVVVSRLLSGSKGRFVLDADALAVLAGWYGANDGYEPAPGQEIILTPHEGEAAKLLGWSKEKVVVNRLETAKAIVERYGADVVLKGPKTLVVSSDGKRVYENGTGNPFMALGGMGDLLAGVIAARWAYLKCDGFMAAASSVWLHGAAGDALVDECMDFSIVNTASKLGSIRVSLDSGRNI
jgi:NAD(P)H-hydrate epimerase